MRTKHHASLVISGIVAVASLVLIIATLKGSNVSETVLLEDTSQKTKLPSPRPTSPDTTAPTLFQSKNYLDYSLAFSIPSSWFESENTITPQLYVSFKKGEEAEIVISTSKDFVGHGVSGELISKEKISISNVTGDIQIWEDKNNSRTIIVNNLVRNNLYYTFEIFAYQNFETNETEFRDFLKTVKFK